MRTTSNLLLPLKPLFERVRRWRYAWAIVPVLVITALSINNHLYYNVFFGYDMPQHFYNAFIISHTGALPNEETNFADGYEASQAPLFYILTAWIFNAADPIFGDSMRFLMPVVLLAIALLWLAMMVHIVERLLQRLHPLVKAMTLSVVMLFPMHVMARVMYSNDIPLMIFGMLAIVALWRLVKTGREQNTGAWLRAAALSGLAVIFKINGVILLGTYSGLAAVIVGHYLLRRRGKAALKVIGASILGLPLMVIPFALNTYHTTNFLGDPLGVYGARIRTAPLEDQIKFLLSFDTTLFLEPFAYENGHRGYWSLEYATLHIDYYNHWTSNAFLTWDYDLLTVMPHRFPIPIARYNDFLVLQYLAMPVTFVMVFAFLYAAYRCVFRWRYAIRDGSALVVIFTVVAHAAQMVRYLRYPDVFAVVIHARFLSFLWFFLFIVGIYWLAKLLRNNRGWQGAVAGAGVAVMAAYCFVALRAMWLPPI